MSPRKEFPHDLDAEKSLLGVLLLHPDRIADVLDRIKPEDFYRDAHAKIFEAMLRLLARNASSDWVTLRAELDRASQLDAVGGPAYLSSLTDGVLAGGLEPALEVVRDRAVRRRLLAAGQKILTAAIAEETAAGALEQAEAEIYALATNTARGELVDSRTFANEMLELIERVQNTGRLAGLSTGLTDLDEVTRGLHSGQLIVVAARPGMGKSAFAYGIANYVAETRTVAMFSLEMSREELALRRLASHGRVNGHTLAAGMLSQTHYARLTQVIDTTAESHLWIDDTPGRNVLQIRSQCRRLRARHQLGLIVIDYLGLMQPVRRGRDNNRQQEVAEMSRACKLLAKEFPVPIVLLAQLNRDPEKRSNRRPQLSDLRESGAIEQDADQVWFVHPPTEANGTAEIIVAKQRNGPPGVVRVAYEPSEFRFDNLAPEADPQEER